MTRNALNPRADRPSLWEGERGRVLECPPQLARPGRRKSACAATHALASLVVTVSLLLAAPAARAAGAPPKVDTVHQARAAFYEAFKAHDYQKAIDAARFWISVDDDDYVPRYNLATLLGATGKAAEGATQLAAAVERGFADRRRLDTDPGLRPLRESAEYQHITDNWPALLDAQLARREALAKKWWTSKYSAARDNDLRVAYAGGIAPEAFGRARDELTRMAAWWESQVLPAGSSNAERDPVRQVAPDPWVLVILPTRTDYTRWAAKRWPRPSGTLSIVAGIYDHDERQLVAQDVGGTLRHEFCHALHWRHQDRLGQSHPIWIQEGLCSLAEDIEVDHDAGGASIRPVPSWRSNSLKLLLAGGTPPNLERLLKMDQDTFVSNAPLANYALARSLFLYLFDRGKLRAWYTAYTQGYRDDPTGKAALESTLGKPLAQVERDFRAWVRALPQVATANRPGGALLPGSYANGTGEGVVVKRAPVAAAAGKGVALSAGDVIVEVAGQPVTDLNDLTRVLGDFEPGATVELRFRRGRGATMNATMTLVSR